MVIPPHLLYKLIYLNLLWPYLFQVVEVEYFIVELLFLALGQVVSKHQTSDVIVSDPNRGVGHDVGEQHIHFLLKLTLHTSLQPTKSKLIYILYLVF